MKRRIRITESDITNMVKSALNEFNNNGGNNMMPSYDYNTSSTYDGTSSYDTDPQDAIYKMATYIGYALNVGNNLNNESIPGIEVIINNLKSLYRTIYSKIEGDKTRSVKVGNKMGRNYINNNGIVTQGNSQGMLDMGV